MKRVISLFSGLGGLDLGLEGGFETPTRCLNSNIHPDWFVSPSRQGYHILPKTSFDTIFANDIKSSAKHAWQGVMRRTGNYHIASIIDLVKQALQGTGPLCGLQAELITGGFPCQDFSVCGKKQGFGSAITHDGSYDPTVPTVESRGMLYYWMMQTIKLIQPHMFIAENVKGIKSFDNVMKTIVSDFESIGYHVFTPRTLYAPQYGIAQTRERVFFIGYNKSKLTAQANALILDESPLVDPYPQPTHNFLSINGKASFLATNAMPAITTLDILGDLDEPHTTPTDVDHNHYSRAKYYGRHCQGNTEVPLNGPANTIRSQHHGNIEFRRLSAANGGTHLLELSAGKPERRLSVRECARIQSLPDSAKIATGTNAVTGAEAYRLVGNAVPPLLAYHIGRRIESIWSNLFG